MKALVTTASQQGATYGIAEAIGRRLRAEGLDTTVAPIAFEVAEHDEHEPAWPAQSLADELAGEDAVLHGFRNGQQLRQLDGICGHLLDQLPSRVADWPAREEPHRSL